MEQQAGRLALSVFGAGAVLSLGEHGAHGWGEQQKGRRVRKRVEQRKERRNRGKEQTCKPKWE